MKQRFTTYKYNFSPENELAEKYITLLSEREALQKRMDQIDEQVSEVEKKLVFILYTGNKTATAYLVDFEVVDGKLVMTLKK